jgi:uncharacterized membrane protein YphA (DoxX/SURF4 family)/peroxiredoxin
VLGLRLLLAGVFATAGVAKLRDPTSSRRALEDFDVPAHLARPGGVLLPLTELAIAIALVIPLSARWGALAGATLLGVFVVVIANAMAHGRAPDCHCFGQVHSEPAGWSTLARNGVLIALATTVVATGPGPGIETWVSDRSVLELALVAAALAAATLGAWRLRAWSRKREHGRALLDAVTRVEKFNAGPPGKPIGSIAPPFELRDVRGDPHSLEELRGRGKPVVLVFVHARCGPCKELLPHVAAWQAGLAERLTIAVVAEGSARSNRSFSDEHGLGDYLLQKRSETYDAYEARGTPSAVVIDPEGAIASVTGVGQLMIEELIRLTLRRSESRAEPSLAA